MYLPKRKQGQENSNVVLICLRISQMKKNESREKQKLIHPFPNKFEKILIKRLSLCCTCSIVFTMGPFHQQS